MWELGIFDWDGTLYDSVRLSYDSAVAIFRHYGIKPPSFYNWRNEISANFPQSFYELGVPASATIKDMNDIHKNHFLAHPQEARLYPGAPELLRLCEDKNIVTSIVSGQVEELITLALREHDLFGLIDDINADVRDKEEALVQVVDSFAVVAENAFYADDTAEGVTAAKKLGIATIGITGGFNSPGRIARAEPDFLANSLHDVMRIIEKGGRK